MWVVGGAAGRCRPRVVENIRVGRVGGKGVTPLDGGCAGAEENGERHGGEEDGEAVVALATGAWSRRR